ncbi:Hypothetical protein (Fragment) [Durusdinium trenchii]|uniref:Mitochondrial splicing suppressor 51-like C-terminal domain-containing protein n=1 Tax=Durusdinium trenchii TaxID=1381693 RepID=A0ABP0L3B4_9DINO
MAFERFVAASKAGDKKEDDKLKQDLLSGSWEALGEPTRSFRERHGFPATLAWALLQLNFPSFPSRRVDLWVLGARTGMEGWLAEEGLWDFLAKVFPRLEWRIRLIGPEMQDGVYRSTLVEVEGVRLKGHEWMMQSPAQPDLVVCFNSGIGTLSLSITKPWLPTVAALLKLDAPVLFTSFGAKERKGEDFLLRGLFKAGVLVDFLENPFRQRPEDRPGCYRSLEDELLADARGAEGAQGAEGEGVNLCNAQVWWARGSELPEEELLKVALKAPKVLEELTQNYALQGAYKSWIVALTKGNRRVGESALENFEAAFKHADVLRALAKLGKRIAEAMAAFVRRHGPHPLAKQCVKEVLLAKEQELMKLLESGELDPEDLEEDDETSGSAWANGVGPDGGLVE